MSNEYLDWVREQREEIKQVCERLNIEPDIYELAQFEPDDYDDNIGYIYFSPHLRIRYRRDTYEWMSIEKV